jgi:cytochrome o ubiquinol oxidase subunit IV
MSQQSHTSTSQERGTTASYIIGFVLSLLFTVIPYYFVVHKTFAGNTLLAIILGVAILQMAIQIFFFLHLGRGPKPLYNVAFFAGTIVTIVVVIVGSIFIINNLNYNMSPADVVKRLAQDEAIAQVGGEKTGACQEVYANHIIVISDGQISPLYTTAHLCDTITFTNMDKVAREIGFGSHPVHNGYAGHDDLLVDKGRNKTITLNQAGTYQFHDHLDPTVTGAFTVTP